MNAQSLTNVQIDLAAMRICRSARESSGGIPCRLLVTPIGRDTIEVGLATTGLDYAPLGEYTAADGELVAAKVARDLGRDVNVCVSRGDFHSPDAPGTQIAVASAPQGIVYIDSRRRVVSVCDRALTIADFQFGDVTWIEVICDCEGESTDVASSDGCLYQYHVEMTIERFRTIPTNAFVGIEPAATARSAARAADDTTGSTTTILMAGRAFRHVCRGFQRGRNRPRMRPGRRTRPEWPGLRAAARLRDHIPDSRRHAPAEAFASCLDGPPLPPPEKVLSQMSMHSDSSWRNARTGMQTLDSSDGARGDGRADGCYEQMRTIGSRLCYNSGKFTVPFNDWLTRNAR